jgi:hypothetical protein
MMYIEYIERDRTMPVEIFRYLGNQESAWTEGSVDKMVLQLGRTMRLGPHPSYLALWDIPDLKRLDDWEDYFHSPSAGQNRRSQAMHRAIHIQRAGVYDVLADHQMQVHSIFVVEYYQPQGVSAEDALAALQRRAKKHSEVSIAYILMRIGALGPDPPLLAIWNGPSYTAFEQLFRDEESAGLRLETCGVYRKWGDEIL